MKSIKKKDDILKRAPMSWDLSDYLALGEEPPSCVVLGVTEGQALEGEDIEHWIKEELHTLYVLRDEYPDKYESQYSIFLLDLEYLCSLGKMSREDLDYYKQGAIVEEDRK